MFGLVSFIIKKKSKFDAHRTYELIGAVTLVGFMSYIMAPMIVPPHNFELSIERLTKWMINFLPGAIIGDLAGVVVAELTGEKR